MRVHYAFIRFQLFYNMIKLCLLLFNSNFPLCPKNELPDLANDMGFS